MVAAIGAAPSGWRADRTIDARGLVVCPGLIDLSARLREPGFEYKATLESEMEAAVAGGVTSLACPPDTDPPLDEPGLVEMLKHRARSLNQAHVYPIGALTVAARGRRAHRDGRARRGGLRRVLARRGAVDGHRRAVARDAIRGDVRPPRLAAAAGRASRQGRRRARRRGGDASRPAGDSAGGGNDRAGVDPGARPRAPACASTSAGSRRRKALRMVRAAKQEGLPVTCDVAVHHLHLCDVDIGWFDPQCRLIPPLRGTRDRAALRAGLADGTIDLVCSDHTPVDDDGKQVPFGEAEPGATGLELLLPLTLKWAQEDGIALPDALARITAQPAAVLGSDAGQLGVGAPADVCVFDPGALLAGRAGGAQEPGQEHAVPRPRSLWQGARHDRRRTGRPRSAMSAARAAPRANAGRDVRVVR